MKKQTAAEKYADIIHLPHAVSQRYARMPMQERAAQFSPFAALTGYGEAVEEAARLTEQRPILSEEEQAQMDWQLQQIARSIGAGKRFAFRYFVPDERKSGGSCRTHTGAVRKIDTDRGLLVLEDGMKISLHDLVDIREAENRE